jgi:Ca2+-binding RTX toxin-like protein
MAYSSTFDERYAGGLISNDADDYDAYSNLNTTWRLAEGDVGYGNLTDAYITADRDIYSLGVLSAGHYSIDVDQYSWDFSNLGFGSVSRFELLDSVGATVDTSFSTFSNIDFTVYSSETYYVQIIGSSSFSEGQYRVEYTQTGNLEVNSSAVFGDAFHVGELFPGEVISASVNYFDADGNSNDIVSTGWYLDGEYQEVSSNFVLTADDVGKELSVNFGFIDDLGNLESSSLYVVGTVSPGMVSNGNANANSLIGSSYNDTLNGKGGSDTIKGLSGDDILKGSGGSDVINGGGGHDKALGGAGNDVLIGGGGHDTLSGGGGKDTIKGQKGSDFLTGNGGSDVFQFQKGDGRDTIADFQVELDQIEIGRGASRLSQLSFEQIGNDVLVSFSNVQITVLDVQADALNHAEHFIF